jgi:hypothetical protein
MGSASQMPTTASVRASDSGALPPLSPPAFLAWATVRVGVRLLLFGSLGLLCSVLVLLLMALEQQRGAPALLVFALVALVSGVLLATGVTLSCAVPRATGLRERAEAVVCGLLVLAVLLVVGALGIANASLSPEELRHLRNAFVLLLVVTELCYLSFLRGVARYIGERRLARGWLVFILVVSAAQAFFVWLIWRTEWGLPGEDPFLEVPPGLLGGAMVVLTLWYLLLVHQVHQGLTQALLRRKATEGEGAG